MTFSIESVAGALDAAGLLVERHGVLPPDAQLITDDSRTVRPGALFVAVRGAERDGHDFLDRAAAAGTTVAIVEDPARTTLPALVVRDGRRAAAIAASAAFGWPARELRLVGVTGTNGKTTTVNILRHLLDDDRGRSASIGTLGVLLGSAGEPMEGGQGLTTPGPVELQRVFRRLVERGVTSVAMEVSSHSLDQHRVDGVEFDVAVFTNLTRDHLDYHGDMERYFAAKRRLLEHLKPHATYVINLDDRIWNELQSSRRRVGFSTRITSAEVHARDLRFGPRGSEWTLAFDQLAYPVHLPLIGDFNVANALAAASAAYALGMPTERIAARLADVPQVPGRLEILRESPTVLRDYAHTPDALERAIASVRPFTAGRLIVLFGCGGDRDPGKRPQMGAIAEQGADFVMLTSDNPRTEDPEAIIDDIEAGMTGDSHRRIEDRRRAIAESLEMAGPDDVVLLAGKGHETYQIRGTERVHFDEREIVNELAQEHA